MSDEASWNLQSFVCRMLVDAVCEHNLFLVAADEKAYGVDEWA